MKSDRRTHVPYSNHPRQSSPPDALHRTVTIKDIGGWIGAAVFILATLTALGFAGYVLFNLIR